jgi:hypothetical protein
MSSAVSLSKSPFDDLEFTDKTFRPLWTLPDLEDEEAVLLWCKETIEACEDYYGYYFQVQQDNLMLFRGVHWIQQDRYANKWLDRQGILTRRSPRVVINHLYDFVEQWVSRLTRYRPAVAIYPASPEQSDADDAKIAKDVLDYIWYANTIDKHLQEFVRQVKIFGEAYLWITWNPNKGDLHPDWIEAQKNGYRIPVLGKDGQPVLSEKGEPLFVQTAVRTGDVEYKIVPPWHVFDMPCRSREDIDWSIRWSSQNVDYVKAKYPEKEDKIKSDDGFDVFANFKLDVGKMKNECIVYELFHRSTEFLGKGRYIKFTKTAILENTELPYQHGKIPYVYLDDIQVPDQIRGMSFFQQLFPLQHQVNACASLIYKSFVLMAHPKIAAREGSVNINQLVNDSTVVLYNDEMPSILSMPPMNGEVFNYINKLESTLEKLSGIFTMSRGQAPSGVRAAKALRVLEEQEDKRAYVMAVKYNEIALIENAKMSLSTMGAMADDSDGRLARILGKDNEYRIRKFKAANLAKPYDVRIENSTALSQSPAARIEELIELSQVRLDPDAPITKGQFINFLDMTADEQFKDIATRASRCAMSENDDMASGVQVAEPAPEEDLIVHWQIHTQIVQGRDYKERMAEDRKAIIQQHIYITEYLMFEKAYGLTNSFGVPLRMPNLAFRQQMELQCPSWPVFFKLPVPSMPPMGMAPLPGAPMEQTPIGPEAGGVVPTPIDPGAPVDSGASVAPPPLPPQGPLI